MSSIINLSYYSYEDTFYFIDTSTIDTPYRLPFSSFLNDVVESVNLTNPTFNVGLEYVDGDVNAVNVGSIGDVVGYLNSETGEAAIPFSQKMKLSNIVASQVLTNYDDDTQYYFAFEVQNRKYSFNAIGSRLRTYQDIINFIDESVPTLTMKYTSTTRDPNSPPSINFRSNTLSSSQTTGSNGESTGFSVTSSIKMTMFANQEYTDKVGSSGNVSGVYANFDLLLPEPVGADILTNAPNNDTNVFLFSVGTRKNQAVLGRQAQTYQGLVDTINKFEGINAVYRMDGSSKHQIYLYIPIPKTPTVDSVTSDSNETDPEIIKKNVTLRQELQSYVQSTNTVKIEDFSGLASDNNSILHILGNAVYGGYDLLTTLQNSKRANGSYWTEVITIQNDQTTSNQVALLEEEQARLVETIDDDSVDENVKRKAALDLNTVVDLGGGELSSSQTDKTSLIDEAQGRVPSLYASFDDPKDNPFNQSVSDDEIGVIAAGAGDNGVIEGALNSDGTVNDESKLTSAQKSKMLPPRFTTVN